MPSPEQIPSLHELYDDDDSIQGEVPNVKFVAKSFDTGAVADQPHLTSDEELHNFLQQEPQRSFIEEQSRRGNIIAAARKATHAVLTIASEHEKEALGAAGATLAVGTAAVVLWHKHHHTGTKGE